MNYIHHLNTFLWLLQRESRLTPSHISLYLALFHHWNCNRFQNPFPLYRERLMQISGIGSKNTYSKCMKDLHKFGYVRYDPSLHKNHRPKVSLVRWKIKAEINRQLSVFQNNPPENNPLSVPDIGHLIARIGTLTDPDPVQPAVNSDHPTGSDLGPNIKQGVNNENFESEAPAPGLSVKNQSGEDANRVTPGAGGPPSSGNPALSIPPSRDEVLKYFETMKYPEIEALKFFAHYRGNGWQQGGKIPIKDWQGVADKWILNSFNNENKTNQYARTKSNELPGQLHHQQDKDYDNPL